MSRQAAGYTRTSGKRANPGQLTVKIRVLTPEAAITPEGGQSRTYRDEGATWCRWANVHGTESLQAHAYGLREPATLTLRFHPALRTDSVIVRASDGAQFDVISVDNVEERGFWQEVKVQRRVEAI